MCVYVCARAGQREPEQRRRGPGNSAEGAGGAASTISPGVLGARSRHGTCWGTCWRRFHGTGHIGYVLETQSGKGSVGGRAGDAAAQLKNAAQGREKERTIVRYGEEGLGGAVSGRRVRRKRIRAWRLRRWRLRRRRLRRRRMRRRRLRRRRLWRRWLRRRRLRRWRLRRRRLRRRRLVAAEAKRILEELLRRCHVDGFRAWSFSSGPGPRWRLRASAAAPPVGPPGRESTDLARGLLCRVGSPRTWPPSRTTAGSFAAHFRSRIPPFCFGVGWNMPDSLNFRKTDSTRGFQALDAK